MKNSKQIYLILTTIVFGLFIISNFVAAQTPTVTFQVLPKYVAAVPGTSTLENPIACYVYAEGLTPNTKYDGLHTGFLMVGTTSVRGSKWEPTQTAGWVSPSTLITNKYTTDANGSFGAWILMRPPTNFTAGVDTYVVRFRIQPNGTTSTINTDSPGRLSAISYSMTEQPYGAIIYGYVDSLIPGNMSGVILAYENETDERPLSAWLIYKRLSGVLDTSLYNSRMDVGLRKNGYFQLVVPPNTPIKKLEIRNSANVVLSSQTSNLWTSGAAGTLTELNSLDPIMLSVKHNHSELPANYVLGNNYPNPFNPSTNIGFCIPKQSFVTLKVYDVLGKEIATLVNELLPVGSYTASWDASNYSNGVYYYRLQTKEFTETKKMILNK